MYRFTFCILVFIFGVQLPNNCDGFTCTKVHSCKCQLDDGSVIDLSPIGLNNGDPKFKNVPDATKGDRWSYNPCYSFTENACKDVAACQIRNGAGFNTGTQDSVQFIYDTQNGLTLKYSAKTDITRYTHVYLQCDDKQDGALTVLGEIAPDGNYYMYLSSKYACPTGGGGHSGTVTVSMSISGGTILLIIFIVLVAVYVSAGLAYKIGYRKAQGKDRIPNVEFWVLLPGLVKEGFQFTFKIARSRAGYTRV